MYCCQVNGDTLVPAIVLQSEPEVISNDPLQSIVLQSEIREMCCQVNGNELVPANVLQSEIESAPAVNCVKSEPPLWYIARPVPELFWSRKQLQCLHGVIECELSWRSNQPLWWSARLAPELF